MSKKLARIRRGMKTRCSFRKLGLTRMIIHRTSKHIYAQIISSDNSEVLVSASTVERIIREKLRKENKVTGNKYAAALVGQIIAERALKQGLSSLSFDRSGFKYHGRIQSLAESSRKFGIKF